MALVNPKARLLITSAGNDFPKFKKKLSAAHINAEQINFFRNIPSQLSTGTWTDIFARCNESNHFFAVSSVYCAKLFAEHLIQSNIDASDSKFLAPGKATAQILLQHFNHVIFPNEPANYGLLDLCPLNSSVTLLTQPKGRRSILHEAANKHCAVRTFNLYRRIPIQFTEIELKNINSADYVLISSADTLFRYLQLVNQPKIVVTLYPRIGTLCRNQDIDYMVCDTYDKLIQCL